MCSREKLTHVAAHTKLCTSLSFVGHQRVLSFPLYYTRRLSVPSSKRHSVSCTGFETGGLGTRVVFFLSFPKTCRRTRRVFFALLSLRECEVRSEEGKSAREPRLQLNSPHIMLAPYFLGTGSSSLSAGGAGYTQQNTPSSRYPPVESKSANSHTRTRRHTPSRQV